MITRLFDSTLYICKVFEVGEFLDQPYIAMEYVDGQPLHMALRRLTLEQKILLLQQIALAVHAAHSQGILHRDCVVQESDGGARGWDSWGMDVESEERVQAELEEVWPALAGDEQVSGVRHVCDAV